MHTENILTPLEPVKLPGLKLALHPDPILLKAASSEAEKDWSTEQLESLIQEMHLFRTKIKGIGLAAPQVKKDLRLFVYENPEDHSFGYMLNPKIIDWGEGELSEGEEGCLSYPGIFVKMPRWSEVTVEYQDLEGKTRSLISKNPLLSRCLQHEIDHLYGHTIYHSCSKLVKKQIGSRMKSVLKQIMKNQITGKNSLDLKTRIY